MHVLAKFDVSSSNPSRDMEGVPNFKSRSRDLFLVPFDPIFLFPSLVLLVMNLLTKFYVSSSNRSRDMEGVPKFQN